MNTQNAHLMTEKEREGAVRVMESIIQTLTDFTDEIRRRKIEFAKTGNPDDLSFAANSIGNLLGNLRLDLLVKYAAKPFIDRAIDSVIAAERISND